MSDSGLYWRGVIRRLPTGHTIYIHALRSTAEFFGWAEAFDQNRPEVVLPALPNGKVYIQPINRSGARGGRRLQISRTKTKSNRVGCAVNVFRIAKAATYADLRAVARATRVEWFWMTDFRGRRRSASEFLDHF